MTATIPGDVAKTSVVSALAAWTFGLAPPLLFLLTWTDEFSRLQQMGRAFALPVLAAQLAIILMSAIEGSRLGRPQWLPLSLLGLLLVHAWIGAVGATLLLPSLIRTGIWTIQLAFGFAIVNLWHHRLLDLEQFRTAILAGIMLVFAMLVVFVATTPQDGAERIGSLPAYGNVRWFAYCGAASVGLAAPGYLRERKLSWVAAAMGFALVSWSGSRGGFLAVGAGMAACAIINPAFRPWRVWLRLVLSGAAGVLLAVALATVVPFEGQGLAEMAEFTDSDRIEIWRDTLAAIAQRPWLGWGEGQFREIFRDVWPVAQPHNVVLQVLLAWGILGAGLCLALALWMAPRFLQAPSSNAAPFQAAALMLAAYSFIDGALYYTHSLALFAFCCSAVIATGSPREPCGTAGVPPPQDLLPTGVDR